MSSGKGGGKFEYRSQLLASGKVVGPTMASMELDVGVESAGPQHSIEGGDGRRLTGRFVGSQGRVRCSGTSGQLAKRQSCLLPSESEDRSRMHTTDGILLNTSCRALSLGACVVHNAPMLLLNASETASLIDRDALREAVGIAMVEVSAGRVSMPPRIAAVNDDPYGFMAVMPAYVPALDAMATKLVTVFAGNEALGLSSHQGAVLVVEPSTGALLAMLDGDVITAERTAACSALSVDLLAVANPNVLTIVGTGVQARSHALHINRVRSFEQIRIAGRNPEKATAIAASLGQELDVAVVVADTVEAACDGAGVVALATHASEPVIDRTWLSPGAHVTSVGFNDVGREVDTATVVDSLLVVEQRDTAFAGHPVASNDLALPLAEGAITADHIHAELGELVDGVRPGRADDQQLTLYKSCGVAAQDVAAAKLIHEAALAAGIGTTFHR